ncbi:hypothetical protein LRS06_17475 [Hymenobacter sp. J193]|uniref:hypothetical protein n=1 Tax=Hymenobacter sp. J193 TaxID=2898429 RepID=UPI002151DA08|nr:hypothetical protein [Hymenobacter sp. J193]MCR5889528.1 hypothetical protein [Hymenobacter sp. J193]
MKSSAFRLLLGFSLICGSSSAFAQEAPTKTAAPVTTDVTPAELVRSLSNALQLQPHQAQILRRTLETPKGESLTALQKQFHDSLSPMQLARLEQWEKTAPTGLQQRFIALAE